jgi:hypothetical protein
MNLPSEYVADVHGRCEQAPVKTSNIKEEKEYEGHAHARAEPQNNNLILRDAHIRICAHPGLASAPMHIRATRLPNKHVSRSSCELSVHKRAVCLRVLRALPSGGVVKANVTHAQRKSEGSRISRGEIFLRSIY